MRKVGEVMVLRINPEAAAIARKLAAAKGKPLRTLLREILEDVLKEAEK